MQAEATSLMVQQLPPARVLDIDIGNSFIKWRSAGARGRMPTAELSFDKFVQVFALPDARVPQRVRLASVGCYRQQADVVQWCQDIWGVQAEVAETTAEAAGIINSYQEPQRLGVDRWLAMIAAYNQQSRSCCVVDCGSAITVDFVAADGQHLGGYIVPGARLLKETLMANTRRIGASTQQSDWLLHHPGVSTEEAVAQGVALMLDALAKRVAAEYPVLLGPTGCLLVTGGDGQRFVQAAGGGIWLPDLVLDGLAYLLP